jgi:hypothetical protein
MTIAAHHQPASQSVLGPQQACRSRAGLTLLEVLVACGILVIGLSSIAAMLPAAGSRLAQATQADRAGVMAANAYAEVANRRLVSADLFSSGTKACVFGKELSEVPAASAAAGDVTATAAGAISARIDATNGFWLQDDLVYLPATSADTPSNAFVSGTTRIRQYNEGVCWGAMVSSTSAAAIGVPATLSIAVFKKEGGPPLAIPLTQANGMFKLTSPDESTLKRYLAGCSYVLALSKPPAQQPRWFRITSAWKQTTAADCWVVFADHAGVVAFSGTAPTVIGFENVMRVDQYSVTLD